LRKSNRSDFYVVVSTLAIMTLAACGGRAASNAPVLDARGTAVQKALDDAPPRFIIAYGNKTATDAAKYKGFPHVHLTPVKTHASSYTVVTWDKDMPIVPTPTYMGRSYPSGIIGRMIVDKLGDDQIGAFGVKVTPFRAHFEINSLGKELLLRHIIEVAPTDITDGHAEITKDADGNFVAKLDG
jgi:hypothetical protein